jgi:colicin import membrane protein
METTTEITIIEQPELQLLESSKAEQIRKTFIPMAQMLQNFEAKYNELMAIPLENMTPKICEEFKRFRLDVAKVRIETGKAKDKAKEYLKLEDKAIMGVHNILVFSVKEMEDKAKERENYYENLERERLEKLRADRWSEIKDFTDIEPRGLEEMESEVFEALKGGLIAKYNAKMEAEKKAETERLEAERIAKLVRDREFIFSKFSFFCDEKPDFATLSEQDFVKFMDDLQDKKTDHDKKQAEIAAENERLKKEAEAKEIDLELEREKARQEAAKLEAKRQAELKAEREKQAKLEAELKAKKDAEIQAEKERLAKAKAEKIEAERLAKAPIKEQLNKWVNSFELPKRPIDNEVAAEIQVKFNSFKNWAVTQINNL